MRLSVAIVGLRMKCNESRRAFNHGGKRRTRVGDLRWIVVHDTEGGPSAEGAAIWFETPLGIDFGGPGSTQLVVGEDGCWRTLPDDVVPFGVGSPTNEQGLHIEFAGFASQSTEQWLAQTRTMELGAQALANWSAWYGIPLQLVDAELLLAGVPGVTTHEQALKAFPNPSAPGHFDPGPNFPMAELLAKASKLSADGPVPPSSADVPAPAPSPSPSPPKPKPSSGSTSNAFLILLLLYALSRK
jgi:hypothetical protein